ncbi:hypothetical protein Anapl_08965 [Anas platyrhynchos]|uniref:Uncharacterized protein n=1 Tax=Anas platyrhynchos TaxID=8839 RepID=R0LWI6_ANAPL|nr:hypothetical protein Anapl_08965 [Anas platyrhynchos]
MPILAQSLLQTLLIAVSALPQMSWGALVRASRVRALPECWWTASLPPETECRRCFTARFAHSCLRKRSNGKFVNRRPDLEGLKHGYGVTAGTGMRPRYLETKGSSCQEKNQKLFCKFTFLEILHRVRTLLEKDPDTPHSLSPISVPWMYRETVRAQGETSTKRLLQVASNTPQSPLRRQAGSWGALSAAAPKSLHVAPKPPTCPMALVPSPALDDNTVPSPTHGPWEQLPDISSFQIHQCFYTCRPAVVIICSAAGMRDVIGFLPPLEPCTMQFVHLSSGSWLGSASRESFTDKEGGEPC